MSLPYAMRFGLFPLRVCLAALVLLIVAQSQPADAQTRRTSRSRPFGLGIIVGEPTGVTIKIGRTGRNAIDAAAAWSLDGDNDLHLHGDWLYHDFNLIPVDRGRLAFYAGIGGRIRFREDRDDRVGVRIPVGLNYIFQASPFDAFLEVVPVLDLAPDTEFDLNAAIGGRFFF